MSNTLAESKSKNTKYYIVVIIALCLMYLLPVLLKPGALVDNPDVKAPEAITQNGVTVLCVFFGVLISTMFTGETFWPAMLGMFALVMGNFTTASGILSTWFGNTTIQQIIWVMAFTGAVTESGAVDVLAKKFLKIKGLKGHPMKLILLLFFAVMICAEFVNSPTAMLLLWYPILDGICDVCQVKKDSDLKRELMLGVFIACMGAYALPFKGVHLSSIAIISGIMSGSGLEFNNGIYLLVATLVVAVFITCYALFMKYVWKTDLSPLADYSFEKMGIKDEDLKMNTRQKILLGCLIFGVLFLIISLVLPKQSGLYKLINSKIGSTWVWIAMFSILCMFRDKEGKPFINGVKLLQQKTMWGILAVAGCFTICGTAIAADTYGIKYTISQFIGPILGSASWPLMVFFCVAISCVFTNFTNGMPVSFTINAICIPIACGMQLAHSGGNASVLAVATIMGSQCAFMTHGAIAYAPIMLGREEMTTKFIWSKGAVTNLLFIVLCTILCVVFGYLF